MKDIINKTNIMMSSGYNVMIDPKYLDDQGHRRNILNHDRVVHFLDFQKYIFSMSDSDISRLMHAMKQFVIDEKLSEDSDSYCDQLILKDVIDYQVCLRSKKNYDPSVLSEIAHSYKSNIELARKFDEITSEFMIEFVKNLLNKYSKKH